MNFAYVRISGRRYHGNAGVTVEGLELYTCSVNADIHYCEGQKKRLQSFWKQTLLIFPLSSWIGCLYVTNEDAQDNDHKLCMPQRVRKLRQMRKHKVGLTRLPFQGLVGPARSVRCAVRLVFRRSRIQSSGLAPSFVKIWSWNNLYDHSLPTADSSSAVVGYTGESRVIWADWQDIWAEKIDVCAAKKWTFERNEK